MMHFFKRLTLPQSILLAVVVLAFAAVYLYGPEETKDSIEMGILAVWGAGSTLLGPLVRKRIAEATADEPEGEQ